MRKVPHTFRLPPELVDLAQERARKEHRTLTNLVEVALWGMLDPWDGKPAPVAPTADPMADEV